MQDGSASLPAKSNKPSRLRINCHTPRVVAILPDINCTIQIRPVNRNIGYGSGRNANSFLSRAAPIGVIR